MTSSYSILFFFFFFFFNSLVSYQQQHPKIVSKPSRPLIGRSGGDITFNWTFTLWPGRTWNESVVEVVFGMWKATGYITPKLMVVSREGQVLIRPNFEDKVSCEFDMSRLQVAFMFHNISVLDQKQYALQVEFGLAHNPLTDVVMLLLHGNKFCMILMLIDQKRHETGLEAFFTGKRARSIWHFPSKSQLLHHVGGFVYIHCPSIPIMFPRIS